MKARLLLVGLLLAATPAVAQSDDGERLRAQLRQVTLQLRQAQDDQAAAQAQKVAIQMERDTLKKQLAAAQADLARARHTDNRATVAESELAKVKGALGQATDAAQKEAEQSKAEHEKMQADALSSANVLAACQAKNTKLLAVARQILKEYENFDALDAVGANEPFTKLKRVELENLAQDYGDRIDDGIFDPKSVPAPTPAPAAATPPPKN